MVREKRRFKRKLIEVVAQFKYSDIDHFINEHLKDISIGGMFIATKHPKKIDEKIYFKFHLDSGKTLIEGYGKVVWVSKDGMGIEFLSLDQQSRDLIEAMVNLKEGIS